MVVTIKVFATIWIFTLLPFLLLAALIISIAHISVKRRLRQEIQKVSYNVNETWKIDQRNINITPWHRQIRNVLRVFSFGKVR